MNQLGNTSAIIAVKSGDEYRSTFVFYGGHPGCCGEAILRRYNSPELASGLIDLGDLRRIERSGKVEMYAENGVAGCEPIISDLAGVYSRMDSDTRFCYVFQGGEWWTRDITGTTEKLADNLWLLGDSLEHDSKVAWSEIQAHDE